MDKYKVTYETWKNGKYTVYQKEIQGKVLNIKTSKGIKKIGITKIDDIFYKITDIETGFRFINFGEMKIYNYLQAYKKAVEIYESDLYDQKIEKNKGYIEWIKKELEEKRESEKK